MAIACRTLLPLLLLFLGGCGPRSVTGTVQLGHVASLTGSERAEGEQARQGILLAVEEANQEGSRIHGRRAVVIHADDRGVPETAQAEAVRLIAVNQVAALLGGVDPAEAERLVRAAQPSGVPVAALSPLASPPLGDGVVSLGVAPAYQGRILARFARDKLQPDRVAVFSDSRSLLSTTLADAFADEFSRGKVEKANYESDGDFADLAARFKKTPPQVVLIAGSARDFLKLVPLVKEAAPKASLCFGGPEGDLATLRARPETTNGTYLATVYLAECKTDANQAFVKMYQERFREPPGTAAAMAYEGSGLLFEVMRRARSLEPAPLRRELARLDRFEGLTGPITFKDHHAMRTVFLVRLEDGELKLAGQFEPESK